MKSELNNPFHSDLFSRIFELPGMACLLFETGQSLPITHASQGIFDLLGKTPEQLINKHCSLLDWLHPDDALAYINELQDYLEQPEVIQFEKNDFRILNDQQTPVWIREKGFLERDSDGKVSKVCVYWQIIDEEYHLKHQCQDVLNNMKVIQLGLNIGFFEYFFGTDKVIFSDTWKQLLGYQPHEITDHFSEWEKRTTASHVEAVHKLIDQHIQGKNEWFKATFPCRHKQGHQLWFTATGQKQLDNSGYPYKLVGTMSLTSPPSSNQEEMTPDTLKSWQHNDPNTFEHLFEQAPVGMVIFDLEGILININPKMMDILGYHLSEIKGRSIAQFLHPEDRQKSFENFEKLINGEMTVSSSVRRVFDHSGHIKYLNFSTFLVTKQDGKKIFCSSGNDNTTEAHYQNIQKNLDALIAECEAPALEKEID